MFFTDDRKERDKMIEYLVKQGYTDINYVKSSGDHTYFEVTSGWSGRKKVAVYRDFLGIMQHK